MSDHHDSAHQGGLPSAQHLALRRDLAYMIFKGVELLKELPDGYAFAFDNIPDWTNRIQEFMRLESIAYPDFDFALHPDPGREERVWMYWRGERAVILKEVSALGGDQNPLGRVTMLREESLLSLLITADADAAALNALIPRLFEKVRPPLEIIVIAPEPDHIHQPYEADQDQWLRVLRPQESAYQTALNASRGDMLIFMDSLTTPDHINQLTYHMHDYHVVRSGDAPAQTGASLFGQIRHKVADMMGGGAADTVLLIRRRTLSQLDLALRSRADLHQIARRARQQGFSIKDLL